MPEVMTFWYLLLVFKKISLAGLNSLRQKGSQISLKNWIFDDPFHKKGPALVFLAPGIIQLSGSGSFLVKWGCWGHWGHRGCWGCWGHWGCRGFKASKITTEDFRLIQVLELSFISMFLGKNFLVKSWSIKLDLSNFSVWGCWGQPMLLFWKLVANIKMS